MTNILETLRGYQENYLYIYHATYKRYLHREVDFSQKLIGIISARGVGKTTFLLQYLRDHPSEISKKLYFSADVINVDSLFDIAYTFSREGRELLIIDEIHKYPDFEKELKKNIRHADPAGNLFRLFHTPT